MTGPCPNCGGNLWTTATDAESDIVAVSDCCVGCGYLSTAVVSLRARPCLVCEEPCLTEGQLCPDCAAAGHRVTDTEVLVNIEINADAWRRATTRRGPADGGQL